LGLYLILHIVLIDLEGIVFQIQKFVTDL